MISLGYVPASLKAPPTRIVHFFSAPRVPKLGKQSPVNNCRANSASKNFEDGELKNMFDDHLLSVQGRWLHSVCYLQQQWAEKPSPKTNKRDNENRAPTLSRLAMGSELNLHALHFFQVGG